MTGQAAFSLLRGGLPFNVCTLLSAAITVWRLVQFVTKAAPCICAYVFGGAQCVHKTRACCPIAHVVSWGVCVLCRRHCGAAHCMQRCSSAVHAVAAPWRRLALAMRWVTHAIRVRTACGEAYITVCACTRRQPPDTRSRGRQPTNECRLLTKQPRPAHTCTGGVVPA